MDFIQNCTNRSDIFTQEEFNEGNPPNVIIYFYPNPDEPLVLNYTLCTDRETLSMWLNSDDNKFYIWVPKGDRSIDNSGNGGKPSDEPVYKLFGSNRTDFIANKNFLRPFVKQYGAFPVYKDKQRVGRSFGVSNLHGQAPGETIYWVIPLISPEINKNVMYMVLEHYMDMRGERSIMNTPTSGTMDVVRLIQNCNYSAPRFVTSTSPRPIIERSTSPRLVDEPVARQHSPVLTMLDGLLVSSSSSESSYTSDDTSSNSDDYSQLGVRDFNVVLSNLSVLTPFEYNDLNLYVYMAHQLYIYLRSLLRRVIHNNEYDPMTLTELLKMFITHYDDIRAENIVINYGLTYNILREARGNPTVDRVLSLFEN